MSATKARVLRAASEGAGGTGPLAEKLGISEAMLRKYMAGVFPLPDSLFLRAVDLLLAEREPQPILPIAELPSVGGERVGG